MHSCAYPCARLNELCVILYYIFISVWHFHNVGWGKKEENNNFLFTNEEIILLYIFRWTKGYILHLNENVIFRVKDTWTRLIWEDLWYHHNGLYLLKKKKSTKKVFTKESLKCREKRLKCEIKDHSYQISFKFEIELHK